MKKLAVVLLSGVSLMLSAHAYSQGKVEVTWENTDTVSYTHLTLPTSDLV